MNSIIRHVGGHRWDGVPVLNYKEEGTHFKAISRQGAVQRWAEAGRGVALF